MRSVDSLRKGEVACMFPDDLEMSSITLPEVKETPIVIITGNRPRHKRFALRLQQEFGALVSKWYELDSGVEPRFSAGTGVEMSETKPAGNTLSMIRWWQDRFTIANRMGLLPAAKTLLQKTTRVLRKRLQSRLSQTGTDKLEQHFFDDELQMISKFSVLDPTRIHPYDVGKDGFVDELKRVAPFLILTLGGPLYKGSVISSASGLAINQHAGHSPDFKGSRTVEWALYHRQLDKVASTVHIMNTGADAGPILRRSQPCLFPNDDPYTVFLRVVALGTELMIEVVKDILTKGKITVFNQPNNSGRTYLNSEYTLEIDGFVRRDFRNGWLGYELERVRNY